jgi:hypothetical protein
MLLSTYKRASIAVYVVAMALVSVVALALSLTFGIVFIALFVALGALVFPWHFARVEDRMADYGGRIPMPNAGLGLWGVDIVDDKMAGVYRDPRSEARVDYSSNELDQHPFALKCPYCHAALTRANAKFCDECGKSVQPPSGPPNVAGAKS